MIEWSLWVMVLVVLVKMLGLLGARWKNECETGMKGRAQGGANEYFLVRLSQTP